MSKYDYYDEEEQKEPELLTDWQLCRLRDCWISTKKGMIDQGFPTVMIQLEALKMVHKVGAGYQATELGREYVMSRSAKLRKI